MVFKSLLPQRALHTDFPYSMGIESFTQTYYTPWGIEFSIISVGLQCLNPSVTFLVKVSPSVFEVSRVPPLRFPFLSNRVVLQSNIYQNVTPPTTSLGYITHSFEV